MPDLKISAMTAASTLTGTEIVPLVQSGLNVQTTTALFVSQVLNVNPVTVSQGGTGATTLTGYLYGNGTSAVTASTTIPTSVLTGVLGTTHGGTGLSSYTLGDIIYASASNTLSKLAGNTTTTNKFLRQQGTGSASAAPEWDVIDPSDINTQYGAFHYDYTTTLSGDITNNQTTIPVVSTTGFSATGSIIIENEVITYTGITSNSFTGCTRGAAGSSNSAHSSGAGVGGAQVTGTLTPTTVQINTVDLSNGVTLDTSTNEISFAVGGTYNIQYSAQLFNATATQSLANIWFDLDGGDVASSASWGTIPARKNPSTPGSNIMTVNLFLTVTSSSKVRLRWLSDDGHAVLATYPQGTGYPSAPAVIVTVNQVS